MIKHGLIEDRLIEVWGIYLMKDSSLSSIEGVSAQAAMRKIVLH